MKGLTSFLSGAIMGSLVGATLAILFAPSSGEELRGQMQERTKMIRQEVQHAASQRRAELEKQLALMRSPEKTGMPEG